MKWKANVPNGRTKTSEENPSRKISQHIAMYYSELRCWNASICLLNKRCDSLWKFDFMLLIVCFMSYYTKAKWTINFCLLIYRHFILSIYKNFAQLLSANFVMVSKFFLLKKKKKRLFITAKTTLYEQMLWVWNFLWWHLLLLRTCSTWTYMFHIKSNSKR